jgi:hypothetical protein
MASALFLLLVISIRMCISRHSDPLKVGKKLVFAELVSWNTSSVSGSGMVLISSSGGTAFDAIVGDFKAFRLLRYCNIRRKLY